MSILGKIWGALKWFGRLFTSKAAQDAFKMVDDLLPQVTPIVNEIRDIVPNVSTATLNDIKSAYAKFGIAFDSAIGTIKENPMAFGSALATLALMVAKKRINNDSLPTRIIKAAIELALVGLKAVK